ncbi:MAG: tRNA (adenosine(37)-N6)-dimethylallyltransferase MiaA [Candidatus Omnitrophota bacterium]|nr:tRNA (adenosine(37)-N6)-dimethylallyltransferase MiaA [Candidatus Omnitrophota bacterium]
MAVTRNPKSQIPNPKQIRNTKLQKKNKIIFIIGPTAVGKSELAVKLAKKINGEIVSADSMSFYRRMDIISSKPAKHLRKQIPHHLIDIITPEEEYNVAKFIKESNRKIKEIIKRKKIPIVAGGSGLYVDSMLYGIFKQVKKSAVIRDGLMREAGLFGSEYVYNKLKSVDPEAAERIHPNNLRRVIRALEVCFLTMGKFSELKQKRSGLMDKYDVKLFGLNLERDKLYQRIDARVDKMFDEGLLKEVKDLLKRKLSKTARQALGIKEVEGFLKGAYDLGKVKYLLKLNTRHFAKRQLTWFRRNKDIIWLDALGDRRKIINEITKG